MVSLSPNTTCKISNSQGLYSALGEESCTCLEKLLKICPQYRTVSGIDSSWSLRTAMSQKTPTSSKASIRRVASRQSLKVDGLCSPVLRSITEVPSPSGIKAQSPLFIFKSHPGLRAPKVKSFGANLSDSSTIERGKRTIFVFWSTSAPASLRYLRPFLVLT